MTINEQKLLEAMQQIKATPAKWHPNFNTATLPNFWITAPLCNVWVPSNQLSRKRLRHQKRQWRNDVLKKWNTRLYKAQ